MSAVIIPMQPSSPFAQYLQHGWKLVPIPPGSKGPNHAGWNTEAACIDAAGEVPEGMGAGLAHAFSNTCAIDLDDLFMAQMMFAERGIDLQALLDAPDAVQVVSGRPGSGKLLYRLDTPLPSKKLNIGIKTILEFRGATADGLTVQDVLPPSRHPSGTTYTWAGSGSWQALPPLPAGILAWWQELLVVPDHTPKGDPTDVNWEEVKDALQKIPASIAHDPWLAVIMALNSTKHPEAYEVAKTWSKTCPEKYPGDREFDTRWRSFKDKAITITIASMFKLAYEHGWVKPAPDVIDDFNGLPPAPAFPSPPTADDEWPWEDPVDIFDDSVVVPPYRLGVLPGVFERMMEANYRMHTHASREAYAGMFMLAVACHLRPSVRVEEKPGSGSNNGKMYSINEQAGVVGPSTHGKSATMHHSIGHDDDLSILVAWNKREQASVLEKIKIKAKEIKEKHKGDEQLIKVLIKALKDEMPVPDIINSKMTDKAIVQTCATDDKLDLPMNIIVDEFDNLYSGANYRGDGGNAITDLHRKMFDNFSYSDKTAGDGKLTSDRMAGNIGYNCTPADIVDWFGYEKALKNGTYARQTVVAPGKSYEGQRDEIIDSGAIAAWRDVLVRLHDLCHLNLYHEADPEFDHLVDDEVKKFSRIADEGNYLALWLAKNKIRTSRYAAAMYLVDSLAAGKVPAGSAVIPKAYRRRAWDFLTQFLWPHQVYVHNVLIRGSGYRSAMQVIMQRIHSNSITVMKADDLVGGHAPKSVKNTNEGLIKALLFGFKWLRPKQTRTHYDRSRPWMAFQFEVNPKLIELCQQYDQQLREAHAIGKGIVSRKFGKEWE